MKNFLKLSIVFLILGNSSYAEYKYVKNQLPPKNKVELRVTKSQIPFISNNGQLNDSVLYYAQLLNGHAYVTKTGNIVYSFLKYRNEHYYNYQTSQSNQQVDILALKETFLDGKIIKVTGKGQTRACVNYFRGSNRSKWKRKIPVYKTVSLGEVYEGIEIKLMACGNNFEKLFYIKPGAKPDDIKIKIEGSENLSISKEGELLVNTELGAVIITKPSAFQDYNGIRKFIPAEYSVDGDEYSFKIGDYDPDLTLVIDPILAATFLGGGDADDTYEPSIAIDSDGNVFITGFTSSHDFPTTVGVYRKQFFRGSRDRFVSKFNSDLSELLASTFLGGRGERGGIIGGNGDDLGHAIAVDKDGNVYLAGYTESTDFPVTSGSFNESYNGGRDAFVCKLNSDLSTLLASTYIGGCGDEGFQWPRIDMIINRDGDVYVTGITHSVDFPTSASAFDKTFNGGLKSGDAFVVKLDKDLTKLLAATYVGGSGNEWRPSIILGENKSIIISGETESVDFPVTSEAYDKQAHKNDNIIKDIFISKLSTDLSKIISSTYFGGGSLEEALEIRMNTNGDIYAAGYTESMDFPTTQGAYKNDWNGVQRDAFIAKFNNELSRLIASTLFGGSILDMARGIAIDKYGDVYVAGVTASPDFPLTPGSINMNFRKDSSNQRDAFVSKFSADLNMLLISSTFGGSATDDAYCIEIDSYGNIFMAGLTRSNDFPVTQEAYDNSYNKGLDDCFIVKFDKNLSER